MTEDDIDQIDYDLEIEQIDAIICSYKEELRQLNDQRQRLLAKKKHVDMDAVLEYIVEKGLTAKDVIELICKADAC